MSWRAACLHVSVLILCVLKAAAQIESGSIVGTVVDPAGAVVPGVRLELVSESTGITRSAVSSDHGDFEFNAVPAGAYTLTAEHSGFSKLEKKNLNLLPNDHLSLGQNARA